MNNPNPTSPGQDTVGQMQAYLKSTGYTPPATTPQTSGTSGATWYDQVAKNRQEQPIGARIFSDLSARGKNVLQAVKESGIQAETAAKDVGTAPAVALGAGELGGRIAGEVAGGVGDIIGESAKSAIKALGGDPAKAGQEFMDATNIFGEKNSETLSRLGSAIKSATDPLPENVKQQGMSLLNVLGLTGMGKVVDIPLSEAASGAKALAAKGVDIAKTGAEAAKNIAAKSSEKMAPKVIDAIRQTEDTMTPTMKKEAISAGRQTVKTTRLGGTVVDYTPTPEIERASSILQDKNVLPNPVTASDAPNVVLAKIKSAISRLGGDAEKYLEANPVKVSNAEDAKIFADMTTKAEKTSTATEMGAYKEQIQLFQKQLLGRPGGYTTANYYKALKDYEENVASKLPRGKDALIDPTGIASAKIQAASDIRKAVRDMIGSKHEDFKPKMYDLASLYEARDVAVQNASKVKSQSIFEKHPTVTKAVKAAAIGGGLYAGGKAILP